MNDWDDDPEVRIMRKVFSIIEEMDNKLVKDSNLSLFDPRLRAIRESSLDLFEKSCAICRFKGIQLNDEIYARLFGCCHVAAYVKNGILPDESKYNFDAKIAGIVREAED